MNMRMTERLIATLVLAFGGLGVGLVAQPGSAQKKQLLLQPDDMQIVARGKKIYADNCASCHGNYLEGEPNWQRPKADLTMPAPPHDETGHTWHHTDQLLFDLTKYGLGKLIKNPDYKTNMPIYDGVLEDEEIIAVLSYIKSTWPQNINQRHDEMNLQSKEKKK